VRGVLAAYDLPKAVYIFTGGAIGFAVDTGRLAIYWWQGAQFDPRLWWGLLLFVPVSFLGAKAGEWIVGRIPQEKFRAVVAVFLGLVALRLLIFPSQAQVPTRGSSAPPPSPHNFARSLPLIPPCQPECRASSGDQPVYLTWLDLRADMRRCAVASDVVGPDFVRSPSAPRIDAGGRPENAVTMRPEHRQKVGRVG
jgi:hypothetical protein